MPGEASHRPPACDARTDWSRQADRAGRAGPGGRQLDVDRVTSGIGQFERSVCTELPLAINALIERRSIGRIDERLIDSEYAVEVGGAKHRNTPVGHGRLSSGSGAIALSWAGSDALFRMPVQTALY